MTTPVYFDLAAAQAAEDRDENGAELLPGDRDLIDTLDRYLQEQWDAYWQPIWAAETRVQNRLWLTQQCPGCEDGGSGEPCDEHLDAWCYCGTPAEGGECVSCHNLIEAEIARSCDV
jgi:hypothetical protein